MGILTHVAGSGVQTLLIGGTAIAGAAAIFEGISALGTSTPVASSGGSGSSSTPAVASRSQMSHVISGLALGALCFTLASVYKNTKSLSLVDSSPQNTLLTDVGTHYQTVLSLLDEQVDK